MAANSSMKCALVWLCRLILGCAFTVAAIFKLADPAGFVVNIGHYHLLPHSATVALGLYLPWLELLCGLAVLLRRFERGALLLLMSLCMLFCLVLTFAWVRDLDIRCGCFGDVASSTSLPFALGRTLTLGLIAYFLARQKPSSTA